MRLLTVSRVADRLQVSTETVRQLAKSGTLKATDIGQATRHCWRFNEADLRSYVHKRSNRKRTVIQSETAAELARIFGDVEFGGAE